MIETIIRITKLVTVYTEEGDWTEPDVLAEILSSGEGAPCHFLQLEKVEEKR